MNGQDEGAQITGDRLVGRLEAEARAGRMNPRTASSCKSAVREVLRVQRGDEWGKVVVVVDDAPRLLEDFVEDKQGVFTEGSISSYCSNFRRAVKLIDPLSASESAGSGPARMTYRFPVRPGELATIEVPVDLTAAEANRLALLIRALPMDGETDES